MASEVILSRNEAERVAKLGKYFRSFLEGWLMGLAAGMAWSPAVERELSLVFLEFACLVRLSRNELGNDDQNVAHVERASKDLLDRLERELAS